MKGICFACIDPGLSFQNQCSSGNVRLRGQACNCRCSSVAGLCELAATKLAASDSSSTTAAPQQQHHEHEQHIKYGVVCSFTLLLVHWLLQRLLAASLTQ
jgi:hypothetical protein